MTDSITQSVCAKFQHRAAVGLKKYGVTMDRNDLTELQWLTHAQEEAMDLVVYLEKLIRRKEEEGAGCVKAWEDCKGK